MKRIIPSTSKVLYHPLKPSFINLKRKVFAEYKIVFRINDCYTIQQLSNITHKYQLLFQKFSDKVQQLNLVLIDSIFPSILADLTLEVLIKKTSSFRGYLELKRNYTVVSQKRDNDYMKYKFKYFIHYLLFSNIHTSEICKGEIYSDRIYCKKNNDKEIVFYSIYNQRELQQLLRDEMKVKINYNKSFISDQDVNLCLQLFIE